MKCSKHAPIKVRQYDRMKRVLALRAEGNTFAKIAEIEGLSVRRVREIVKEAFDGLLDAKNQVAADALEKSLKRLDALLEAQWDAALEGDVKACGAAVAIIDRQVRLLGLDAPVRGEASVYFKGVLGTAELVAKAAESGLTLEDFRGPSPPIPLPESQPVDTDPGGGYSPSSPAPRHPEHGGVEQ